MTESQRRRMVADTIIDTLVAHGIDVAFGIPGVHNLGLWEAARVRSDFGIVGVRHEQAAVYAADGVARQTRKGAAAFTITGPGAANTVGAFGEAASSSSPVVLIATEVAKRDRAETGSFGRVHGSPDQGRIFESLAKGVFRIRHVSEVVAAVAQAVELATAAPQGPVYIDVPTDVLTMTAPSDSHAPAASRAERTPTVPTAEADELDRLVAALEASRRPILWAGGGAASDEAAEVVLRLSERLGAPVLTSFAGRGVVTAQDSGWIGLPIHEPETIDLLGDADLLLGLGTAFDGMNTRNWQIPFPAELYAVNVAPTHLLEEGVPHTAVTGDVIEVGRALLSRLDATARPGWADLAGLRDRAWTRLHEREMQPAAVTLLASVDAALERGDVVLADMAIIGYWTSGYAAPTRPRQLLYPVGWGTLGFALPAAIGGAWHAQRIGQRALAVMGDGGFMFAVGELATIRESRLPVTILVVDDGGYGMLRFDQTVAGIEHYGTDLWVPDIAAIGRSFGIPSYSIDAEDSAGLTRVLGLSGASDGGAAIDGPVLVHVKAALNPPRTTSPRWPEVKVETEW